MYTYMSNSASNTSSISGNYFSKRFSLNHARYMLKTKPTIQNRRPNATFVHEWKPSNAKKIQMLHAKTTIRRNQTSFPRLAKNMTLVQTSRGGGGGGEAVRRFFGRGPKTHVGRIIERLFDKKIEIISVFVRKLDRQLKSSLKPARSRPPHIQMYYKELRDANVFYKTLIEAMKKQKKEHIAAFESTLPNKNVAIHKWPLYLSKHRNTGNPTLYFHPSIGIDETQHLVEYLIEELKKDGKLKKLK